MIRIFPPFLPLLLLSAGPLHADAPAPDQWIVLVPAGLQSAVAPLCDLRRRQGFDVSVLDPISVLKRREIRSGEAGRLVQRVVDSCHGHAGKSLQSGASDGMGVQSVISGFRNAASAGETRRQN